MKNLAIVVLLLAGLLINPLCASHESNEAALQAAAQRNIEACVKTAITSKDVKTLAQILENLVQRRSANLKKIMDEHLADFVNGIENALLKQVLNGFTASAANPSNNEKFYYEFQHIQYALDRILDKIQNTEKKLTTIEFLEYPAPYPKGWAPNKRDFLRFASLSEKYGKKQAAIEKKLKEEKEEKRVQSRKDTLKYFEKVLRRKPTEAEQDWVFNLFKLDKEA